MIPFLPVRHRCSCGTALSSTYISAAFADRKHPDRLFNLRTSAQDRARLDVRRVQPLRPEGPRAVRVPRRRCRHCSAAQGPWHTDSRHVPFCVPLLRFWSNAPRPHLCPHQLATLCGPEERLGQFLQLAFFGPGELPRTALLAGHRCACGAVGRRSWAMPLCFRRLRRLRPIRSRRSAHSRNANAACLSVRSARPSRAAKHLAAGTSYPVMLVKLLVRFVVLWPFDSCVGAHRWGFSILQPCRGQFRKRGPRTLPAHRMHEEAPLRRGFSTALG